MRLWHYKLIKYLPCIKTTGDPKKNQLAGQHRECCALRGNGWNKKHETVNYVFNYSPINLFNYHLLVLFEMRVRGFKLDKDWLNQFYRGKNCTPWNWKDLYNGKVLSGLYPEHNDAYLLECLKNLKQKGIYINKSVWF